MDCISALASVAPALPLALQTRGLVPATNYIQLDRRSQLGLTEGAQLTDCNVLGPKHFRVRSPKRRLQAAYKSLLALKIKKIVVG
eukprot:COSAG02_NODE_825_length_16730_cov_58.738260_4_plen_85_part_00